MKTKEELNAIREEIEKLNNKLAELSNDELNEIFGGDVKTDHNQCEYRVDKSCVLSKVQRNMPKCDFCPLRGTIVIV